MSYDVAAPRQRRQTPALVSDPIMRKTTSAVRAFTLTYGNFAAGSYHAAGGVNCAFGDGSIRFITAQIDCGDLSQPAPTGSDRKNSPYGVWGSMGTIAADEVNAFQP